MVRPAYPFESRFASVRGLAMHYADEGAGEPVVFVHGNPSWSYMYRDLIRELRTGYRCVAPDHIGCGLSEKPGEDRYDYTLSRRAEDLEELLDGLGLRENLTLALHDWGGMIGMAYATRHPDRVKRIVLFNTAAFPNPKGLRLPWQLALARDSVLGEWLVRGANAFAWGATRFCALRRPMTPETRAAYLAPYDSWENRIAVHRFVKDIPLVPGDRSYSVVAETAEALGRLDGTPIMICWGERDFVFDGAFLAEWMRRFPRAEIHRFPDAGHYVVEDAPEIAGLMRRFLAAHPLSAGVRAP